jgi:addiction module RelE/StbE family toxin
MAKQIIWSLKAQDDRKEIFTYWNNRNKSKAYSKKLNELFKEGIKLISRFPQIGRPTEIENVRIKVIRDYLIVYEETPDQIHILTIWDGRRDPDKFALLNLP